MDVSTLYSLRKQFCIIAVTGRTGSGCSKVSKMLTEGFQDKSNIFTHPSEITLDKEHNSYKKYRIVYNYCKLNFTGFHLINYIDLLTIFILEQDFDAFTEYLKSKEIKKYFEMDQIVIENTFESEILMLNKIKEDFDNLHLKVNYILSNKNRRTEDELNILYELFNGCDFKNVKEYLYKCMSSVSLVKKIKVFSNIASQLRKHGSIYSNNTSSIKNCFTIAELLNDVIKSIKNYNIKNKQSTQIVIDSMRNPMEIMFFKQRFSAFYVMAVNRNDKERDNALENRFRNENRNYINKIIGDEYSPARANIYHMQNVSRCIQQADIHITYRTIEEAQRLNITRLNNKENTSPFYSAGMQLLKFIALIHQPGIITPSPEERSMQLAYTAKLNSGCISRQVGATVTDSNYAVKAIGWNNTPEGQVPCNLRNIDDLFNKTDLNSFTPYEQSENFLNIIKPFYELPINEKKVELGGRNVCFCFKSVYNSAFEGKNQVHTRSLHAEENAFLQISKYGGIGLKGGKLFTTASPCELCSKKAYQLGIKVIYYIDPYPGIAQTQILEGGHNSTKPELRLFNGAIGNAYHWLYEAFLPFKDELTLILENEIPDLTKKLKNDNEELQMENNSLKQEIQNLKMNQSMSNRESGSGEKMY